MVERQQLDPNLHVTKIPISQRFLLKVIAVCWEAPPVSNSFELVVMPNMAPMSIMKLDKE